MARDTGGQNYKLPGCGRAFTALQYTWAVSSIACPHCFKNGQKLACQAVGAVAAACSYAREGVLQARQSRLELL